MQNNSPVVKRGRGRPPGSRMSKKRPGRPPKPKTVSVSGPNGLVKRRPGRPSKAEPRSVFIPYATNVPIIGAFEQSNGPNSVVPLPAPRPRGRPKKDKSAAASSGVAAGTGKPRGRPPLVPGVDRPKLSRSGRPVGRPKKVVLFSRVIFLVVNIVIGCSHNYLSFLFLRNYSYVNLIYFFVNYSSQ